MASEAQILEYEKYHQNILEHGQLFDSVFRHNSQTESVKLLFNDIKTLTLDNIIAKHRLTKEEIGPFLLSIKTTYEIIHAYNKLDEALLNSKALLMEWHHEIDSNKRSFSAIDKLEFSSDGFLQGGDSIVLKVMKASGE